jgi:hypothetical protein
MANSGPIKLRARDPQDLEVLAAMLQDAIVRPADMSYRPREKRFVMTVSRFRWELPRGDGAARDPEPEPQEDVRFEEAGERQLFQRVAAGLCFDRVRRVRTQNLDQRRRDEILSLLTVDAEPGAITLVFSGGARIRLEVSLIACHMEDLGEPWPTPWRPAHDAAAAGEDPEAVS